jgi:rod shape-determining protein MreD
MVVLHFIVVGLVLTILQTTLCMRTPVSLLAPDFYYVLVAYLALRLDVLRSLIILFPLACVLDVLSGTILGSYALICFGGYVLLRQLAARLPVNGLLYHLPLICLSFLAVSWMTYLLLEFLQSGQQAAWSWWEMTLRTLLVALCSYPLFFLFDLIQKYSQRSFLSLSTLRLRGDNRRRRT